MKYRGGQIVAMALEDEGVEVVYGLPGVQSLEIFDAMRDARFQTVLTTSELSAAFMADAHARVTGQVGCCVISPGPGLTYTLPAVAEALLDSSPLVILVAALPRAGNRRFRIHEIDQTAVARPLCKRCFLVEEFREIAPTIGEAFQVAREGEPGPVLVEIPVHVLRGRGSRKRLSEPAVASPPTISPATEDKLRELARRLTAVKSCCVFAGQGALGAAEDLRWLCEHLSFPVCTTASGRGVLPEDHPLALGFGAGRSGSRPAHRLLRSSEAVLAVGCKFGELATGGWNLRLPKRLFHIDANPTNLEANFPAEVGIATDARIALGLLRSCLQTGSVAARESAPLEARIRDARERERRSPGDPSAQRVSPARFLRVLRERLAREAVLVTDVGLHQWWALSHFPVLAPRTFLTPADFQSMGFCVPAAVAAGQALAGRQVVGVCGDGGFLMTGLELCTAVRLELPVAIFVFRDDSLGLIEKVQQRAYLRTHAAKLRNPDFALLARAIGAEGITIRNDLEIEPGIEQALANRRPCLVEVGVDYTSLPPYLKGKLRTSARQLPWNQKVSFAARLVKRKLRRREK